MTRNSVSMQTVMIDRRAFLAGAGLMAGAVVATALVPLAQVHAAPADLAVSAGSTVSPGAWHVDDVCGHWPPYSYPIGRAYAPVAPAMVASAEPIDHIFLV